MENYLENHLEAEDTEEQEELTEILKGLTKNPNDANSDYYKLKSLVDTEVVGQLKRQAKIKYLEHINYNIDAKKNQDVFYLRDLIRRLKLIDTYLNDPNKVDGYYDVNYHGVTVNLRQILSRAEAFDSLPIIPLVEGYLGETTDQEQGKRQFIFGLKFKLNGEVKARGGKTSFAYHLNLINPDSDEHKAELKSNKFFAVKVLKLFFLYYFVFSSRCKPGSEGYYPELELDYGPIATFGEKFLPILQGNDEEKKKEIFRTISKSLLGHQELQIKLKINKLEKLVKNFLDQQSILEPVEYLLHIGVPTSILENDIDKILKRSTFFKDVIRKNPKEALQYLTVTDAKFNQDILCQLPVKIKIEDIRYHYHPNEKQTFNLGYDLAGIKALPVLFIPKNDYSRKEYEQKFKKRNLLVFTYDLENDNLKAEKAFVYRFTFSLLTYICLKILVDVDTKEGRLFIPLLRLHLKNKQKSSPLEGYISDNSKVLAHLLNEEHLASSQGFDITQQNTHKTLNGLSSLYSVLPKHFSFTKPEDTPKLNKLAIIIVSSRESDSRKGNANRNERISNLMGEVITVNLLEDGVIKLETLKTFSENYPTDEMYSQPSVLLDQITHLYNQRYQHILYIAKAPYSSSLNLTQQDDDDDGLFFL
ncbi:MAG: hypothetical protein LH629_12035, partial [Ignavibacteria bacterium]|nr:hypothetical protein [Ignavibacteria bacterium]